MRKSYSEMKDAARAREAEIVRVGQDVAPLPPVKNKKRKARAVKSFRAFCDSYFSDVFYLPWSRIHEAVAEKVERVVKHGEIFAMALPRGSGKTTLCLVAALWAALTGRARFVALVAASAERAQALLDDLKTWLEINDGLYEDFPEVCHPIRKLERIVHRQKGQKYNGEPTRIEWGAKKIVLPTVEGSKAAGAVVQCSGMAGSQIRGLSFVRADGKRVRPDLCVIDDPQTRESAESPKQCDERERVIKADVLGMAGPGRKIAVLCACTVVAPGDLAERLLDRKRNPDFRGEKYKLLLKEPSNLALWDEYRTLRAEELINDGDGSQATQFYRERQAEMDAGAVSAWPERFNPDEISAIQYAMNLRFRDEAAFQSEYQNEPVVDDVKQTTLDPVELAAKVCGLPMRAAPDYASHAVAYIDVHKDLLYYAALAVDDRFSGAIVDYGTFPSQRRRTFKLANANPTLSTEFPNAGLEGSIYGGLRALVDELAETPLARSADDPLYIERILVDANWGASRDIVYQFCKESAHARLMVPAHGQFFGAASRPFAEITKKAGDRVGPHWRVPAAGGRRGPRHVLIDTNWWKSFLYARLATPQGDSGSIAFCGKPALHANIVSHILAEYPTTVEAKGRRVDEWRVLPNRDNHWLDCLTGACVAASLGGAAIAAVGGEKVEKKTRVSFKEKSEAARERKRFR